MKDKIHTPHNIIRSFFDVADRMEPLKERKNPVVAAILGFALGGVGLGFYFRSFKEFLIPFLIMLFIFILSIPTGGLLSASIPFIWAAYGYRRVKVSNRAFHRFSKDYIEAEIIEEKASKMLNF